MVVCEDSPNAKCCRQLTAHVRGPPVVGPSVASAPAAHLLDFTPHFSPLVLLPAALAETDHTRALLLLPITVHYMTPLCRLWLRIGVELTMACCAAAFRTRITAMLSRLSRSVFSPRGIIFQSGTERIFISGRFARRQTPIFRLLNEVRGAFL